MPITAPLAPAFSRLETGEREAIGLALERRADLLLMDDRDGVLAARAAGLSVVGTLSVLDQGAARGWLDLEMMFERLSGTSFRGPRKLMATMLVEHARRKGAKK